MNASLQDMDIGGHKSLCIKSFKGTDSLFERLLNAIHEFQTQNLLYHNCCATSP